MPENPKDNPRGHLPAHERVRRAVLDAIRSGQWPERIPSERDLAERFEVSHMTARRAVCKLVDEGVLLRGEGRQGTFVARRQRPEATGVIGVLSPLAEREQTAEPYAASLLAGIQEVLCEKNFRLHLAASLEAFFESNWTDDQAVPKACVDGIIKLPCRPDPRFHQVVERLPVVAISTWASGVPRVAADDVAGARQAVEYLLGKGHQRIAHLSHRAQSLMARDRRRGYEQAMEQAGQSLDNKYIAVCKGGHKAIETATRKLIDLPERPTAILCSSDESAAAVIRALRGAGLGVPNDISVMGFGDLEMARHLCPTLTTVAVPLRCLGRCGTKWLLDWIETGERPEESARVLPVQIIERESVRKA